ncbi:MAG: hypothetical protein AAF629_06810 [Chloroflexota bacterium]
MSTKITTLIEQLSVIDGTWHGSAHNQAAVREPKKSKRSKGNLFVLVEAQGQIAQLETVEKHLVGLVRDTYYPANGGVTASLRRAIQTANTWLFEQNSATTANKRVIAGVLAVVIKDDDLFVAQVGPTALYSHIQQSVQRYPERSDWLDHDLYVAGSIDYDDITEFVLGVHHYVDLRVSHFQVHPDDVIILADGRLARHLDLSDIASVIRAQDLETISQNLVSLIESDHCSAMIIQATEEGKVKQPALSLADKVPVRIDAGEGKGFNFTLPAVLQKPMNLIVSTKEDRDVETPTLDFDREHDDVYDSEMEATSSPNIPISQVLAKLTAGLFGGIALLGGGLQTILQLVLPGVQSDTDGASSQTKNSKQADDVEPQLSRSTLRYVAIGLPVIVILFTLIVYLVNNQSTVNNEAAYTERMEAAQQMFSQAQVADPDQATALLGAAEQSLTEASALKEDQTEITSLQADIIAQRDELGQVERLHYIPELKEYADQGTQLQRVIVQGVDIYVLDTGLNRLYQHTVDAIGDTLLASEAGPLLLSDGQDLDGITVNNLIDMAWIPAAGGRQTSDLVILTRSGLIEFNPDWGGSSLPVSSLDQWRTPTAVGNYFGNFYLLDSEANLLYRYKPGVEGYETAPESYFVEGTFVDLAGAVDMAIDGHIYVLFQNGQIKRFLGGQPAPFEVTGLDIPFNNPTSIYTAPDDQTQYLYVADAGNRRIVQLTKEGAFMRQFKPRYEDENFFADLRSIYVDEIGGKMFILSGSRLFAPNIPIQ